MKKIITFILLTLIFVTKGFALTHFVTVSSYQFSPNNFIANVGDTVVWTRMGTDGIAHNTTSASVPEGAEPWASPDLTTEGQTFTYVITIAGSYNYECTFHDVSNNMVGSFTVSAVSGISSVIAANHQLVFPNPFTGRVKIYYSQPGDLMVFNVLGNKVADVALKHPDVPTELDLTNLYPGVYFITLYDQGKVVETRKVVKEH